MKITTPTTSVGTSNGVGFSVRDDHGSGVAAVQVWADATVTTYNYDIIGRAAPDAPWFTLLAGQTAATLQSMNWVPFVGIRLNSATGTGNVYLQVETA